MHVAMNEALRMTLAPMRVVEPPKAGRLSLEQIACGLRERLAVAREAGVGRVPRIWGVQDLVDAAQPHLSEYRELQALVAEAVSLGLAHA